MSLISVETSPLQAAREWRGISLIVAARSSGIPVAAAEALEDGRGDAFGSVDEMIATAIVYAASLGIGRDEAMALLDRTIAAAGEREAGDPEAMQTGSTGAFSEAVQQRSTRTGPQVDLTPLAFDNMPDRPSAAPALTAQVVDTVVVSDDAPTGDIPTAAELPDLPPIPAESDVVRAALEADNGYRTAWEQSQSELEQWAAKYEQRGGSAGTFLATRIRPRIEALLDRTIGTARTDRVVARAETMSVATRDTMLMFRNRLERSEHAPLVVALGAGIVLVAMLVMIGSMMGNDNATPATGGPKLGSAASALEQATQAAAVPATRQRGTKGAGAAQVLRPSQIRIDVLNAGHKKGFAATMAQRLDRLGYRINSTGNSDTRYATSVILYQPRYQREAERLSRQTGITTMDTVTKGAGPVTITIIVV